jgi:hypothetical protein
MTRRSARHPYAKLNPRSKIRTLEQFEAFLNEAYTTTPVRDGRETLEREGLPRKLRAQSITRRRNQ